MMKRDYLTATAVVVSLLMVLAVTPSVHASVLDYHNYVQGRSDTILQYDFDGSTNAERRQDKFGSNDLAESNSAGAAISYGVSGFDSTSQAFTAGSNNAFQTSNAIKLPAAGVSFEGIVKVIAANQHGYTLGANINNNRSYFCIYYNDPNGDPGLKARAGTGNWLDLLPSTTAIGHWYYVATTMSYDGTNSIVNTYSADLSSANPTLEHVANNVSGAGTFSYNTKYGVGGMFNGTGIQDIFSNGAIDEVSLYNGVKDSTFFQANLDRILAVPEPSVFVLVGTALAGLLAYAWRRRK